MTVRFRRESYNNQRIDDPLGFEITYFKAMAWADWMPLIKNEGLIGTAPAHILMPGALELFAEAFEIYKNDPVDVGETFCYEWDLIQLLRAARKDNTEIQWS